MQTIEVTGDPKQIDGIFRRVERNRESFILAHNGVAKCIIKPVLGPENQLPSPRSRKPSSH